MRLARAQGVRLGLFRPVTIWPFAEDEIARLAASGRTLVVAEMNLGQLALEVERASAGCGAVERLTRADGDPIVPQQILEKVLQLCAARARSPTRRHDVSV